MQDITKAKCSSSSIANGTEGRLIDKRDNKVYWVAKLKDGLCWMTQNLDYDGGAVDGYSGSDIVSLNKATSFSSSNRSQKLYYDPGQYVYVDGSNINSCGVQSLTNGYKNCNGYGWVSVDILKTTWTATNDDYFINVDTYVGVDSQSICSKEIGLPFGNNTYDRCKIYNDAGYEHYLAGNFYNWTGATNGAADSTIAAGTTIDGSLCPTGWKLPVGNASSTGSFGGLLNGLTDVSIMISPYYYIRTGIAGVTSNMLTLIGTQSYYWSATAANYSASNVYSFGIDNTEINLSATPPLYYGNPVRCVAR